MKSTICTLNADFAESKKMSLDNHLLVSAGDQLSKLNTINKRPSLLAADRFYDVVQAVIPKASPEAISLRVGLIVGGLFASLGINNNKIISGIPNCIPIPSNLRYVVKKSREATFMITAGFVFNYPCSMLYNKGGRAGIGRLVKEIAFWGGE